MREISFKGITFFEGWMSIQEIRLRIGSNMTFPFSTLYVLFEKLIWHVFPDID